MLTRRGLLRLGAVGAAAGLVYGGFAGLRRAFEPALAFEPITGLAGFRRMAGGPVSRGAPALTGLDRSPTMAIPDGRLCDMLFGPRDAPDRVAIAYFTDYRCVNCRDVSPILHRNEAQGGAEVVWHELPLLGQASRVAARAALAARAQGAYGYFHDRMMGAPFLPTPPYLSQIARDAGIDAARLLRDMNGPAVARQLAETAALARRFGFIGTPAFVVGRSAVLGAMQRRMFDRLIAAERAAAAPPPCG